ncbi:MAG: undecaprenyl-diphosphate phosphatase [Gemmatimonadetes bacterium]|nr:undecaprenyl-diphosphate phosphatase [Gemmatimonadota bacterium]
MLYWKAVILGLVEGATEFIPVSSTGHLILAGEWLNWTDTRADTFIIFVQLPAILAVVWMYRKKIWEVTRTLRSRMESRRLALNIVIATIPAVAIGLPTDKWVEAHMYGVLPVAAALVLGGIAILLIERREHPGHVKLVDDIPLRLAIGIGCFQVLAMIFPGVSRSGATIMGGLLLGLSRLAATEFSFFLAIPAMFGATAVKLWDARETLSASDLPIFAVGAVVSFASALIVIRGLLKFVSSNTFVPFAWYRIALGAILIAVYWDTIWTG